MCKYKGVIMKNELALNGEMISTKIYPKIFNNVGMIRGEYLIREYNESILLKETQNRIKSYLDKICKIYEDEQIWYRLSELTNTEINNLNGTKKKLDDRHPLMGMRGIRRMLLCKDEFELELSVINNVYFKNKNLSLIIPFINSAAQLKEAINIIRYKNSLYDRNTVCVF